MEDVFKFIDLDCSPNCMDQSFEILDEEILAQYIAYLVMGHSRHLMKIIETLVKPTDKLSFSEGHKKKIISYLELDDESNDNKRYRRDGWLFQMISWLVVYFKYKGTKMKMAPPHDQPSMHGIDGLLVVVNDGHIQNIVITEDKCTENPISIIRTQVLPEFEEYEKDLKDTPLLNNVGTLLDLFGEDYDEAHNEITNKDIRQYRIGITREETHNDLDGRRKLFEKYEQSVKGTIDRRIGSSVYIKELRKWMDSLASKVIACITKM